MAFDYDNVLITGATSGIGEGLALGFARRGVRNLFIGGRDAGRLAGVAAACEAAGATVHPKAVDGGGVEAIERLAVGERLALEQAVEAALAEREGGERGEQQRGDGEGEGGEGRAHRRGGDGAGSAAAGLPDGEPDDQGGDGQEQEVDAVDEGHLRFEQRQLVDGQRARADAG